MKALSMFAVLLVMLLAVLAEAAEKADYVLVEKKNHQLSTFRQGKLLASYHIVLGNSPVGAKVKEGDGKTPEGRYTLDVKKEDSAFHKALHVSYPGPQDIERAKKLGVSPGKDIMVHGQKNGFGRLSFISQKFNWTRGCIALSDEDMDALWEAVDAGTPIEIRP